MPSFNKAFIMGNLTHDPDYRTMKSGSAVCKLSVAINHRFIQNGQEQQETTFVEVSVYGKQADHCRQFLAKGSPVFIEGRLKYDQWEDRNGGGKRSKLSVIAERVQFTGGRPENQQQPQQAQPRRQYGPEDCPDVPDYGYTENDIPY